MYSEYGDEKLVEKAIDGDVKAFSEIISRYEEKLQKYVVRLIQNTELAEDVVQDTFLKVYRNLRGFDQKRKFSSWIYRIAHNEAVNKIKKETKIKKFSLDELFVKSPDDVEKDYEKKELGREVRSCVNELDYKYKDVVVLYYLEDKSYEEICEILNLPLGTVSIRLSRARKLLKEICQKKKL
ncbi:RNA polymerase sigma factor [Patescibacteria group bacterium]